MSDKKVIGVVDDHETWRELVPVVLEDSGYSIRVFSNPHEVLEAYTELDGISTDGQMPNEGDGLKLARDLREREYSGPIVMVSGTLPSESEMKEYGIDAGFDKADDLYNKLAPTFDRLFKERENKGDMK